MKQQPLYTPFDHFVFRTPLFPIGAIEDQSSTIASQPFQEALYLASPDMFQSQETERDKAKREKREIGLQKYFLRSCTRCTPFGLFAGCSTGIIGDKTSIELTPTEDYRRKTRLDMQYICALIQHIENDLQIRPLLLYYPNDSIYEVGGKIRYVEYRYQGSRRMHRVSSVEPSEYLQIVINEAHHGKTIQELAASIVDEDITTEDAVEFVNELISEQLLKSDIDPCVVGGDVLETLIDKLSKKGHSIYLDALTDIHHLLSEIDSKPIGTTLPFYKDIISIIDSLNVGYEIKYLFQTDMTKPHREASISKEVIDDINTAIVFLSKLNQAAIPPALEEFKNEFQKRYEEEDIPLAIALDGELGIGFPKSAGSGDVNILVDDVVLPIEIQKRSYSLSPVDIIILKKYIDAIKNGQTTMVLDDDDFPGNMVIPPAGTISVMCSIINESDGYNIHWKSAGGTSGGNLIGRFCHTDPVIHRLVSDIASKEKECDSDAIFAEISHLPESRIGNIASRPLFRDYIIPYLSNTDANIENRIGLNDLIISVRGNKLRLRSKKYGRDIVPRLTCAHNFSLSSIPIYQFLCQFQYNAPSSGFSLPLGDLFSNFEYMPRITYRNIILKRQKWMVHREEIDKCDNMSDMELTDFIHDFVTKRKIVPHVVLPDSDNEMYLNLNDIKCVRMLLSIVKGRPLFYLEEFLFNKKNSPVKTIGSDFANEFIFFLYR